MKYNPFKTDITPDSISKIEEIKGKVTYTHTNESLETIISGLNPKGNILSIIGSGDQAFAMAEYSSNIIAVDVNVEQVEYANLRLEALKTGFFVGFFDWNSPYYDDIKKYFSTERLNRIRERILSGKTKITFLNDDIFSKEFLSSLIRKYGRNFFDRLYLSNAISFSYTHSYIKKNNVGKIQTFESYDEYFRRKLLFFRPLLKDNSLIYVSDSSNNSPFMRDVSSPKLEESDSFSPAVYIVK